MIPAPLTRLWQHLVHSRRSWQARGKMVARLTAQLVFETWVFHRRHNQRMEVLSLLTSLAGALTLLVGLVGFFVILLLGGRAMALEDAWMAGVFVGLVGLLAIGATVAISLGLAKVHQYCFEPGEEDANAAWSPTQHDANSLFRQRCKQLVQIDNFHHMSAGEWALAHLLWGFEETARVRHTYLNDVLPRAPATAGSRVRL